MKIDTQTVNVLKNFSLTNPSIILKPGNVIRSMSTGKNVMAKATVKTSFPKQAAIYNVNRFIAAVSMFSDPELEFGDKFVKISGDNRKVVYTYAAEDIVKNNPPERDMVLPSVDVTFTLTNEDLNAVEKAAGILDLDEYHVVGDGKKITIQADRSKDPTGDQYSVELGDTDKTFKAVFKKENIHFLPGTYVVEVCSAGIAHFTGPDAEYWVAVEQNSVF